MIHLTRGWSACSRRQEPRKTVKVRCNAETTAVTTVRNFFILFIFNLSKLRIYVKDFLLLVFGGTNGPRNGLDFQKNLFFFFVLRNES